MCSNALAHPEEPRFRTIRILNPHFQQTVARHAGGIEVSVDPPMILELS